MLVGNLVFQVSLSVISKEEIESLGSDGLGAITIVMFFANMSKYGLCIMTYMYFRTKSLGALLCMVAGLVLTGIVIILGSRRGDAANTFFILVLGLFMARVDMRAVVFFAGYDPFFRELVQKHLDETLRA